MITRLMLVAVMLFALAVPALAQTPTTAKQTAVTQPPVFNDVARAGKKCWISDDLYFIYRFDGKPKLGTSILKIRVFDRNTSQITSLAIRGITGMPSMSGAHDSGEVPFKLNKRGDYLLPVNVVMPGEWEVKLIFLKDKAAIYRGRFTFKV
jgi:hypothetical protein